MKTTLCGILVCVVVLNTFAKVLTPPTPLIVKSGTGTFTVEIMPPKFKMRGSFELFQNERFLELTGFEGAEIAGSACIRASMRRKTATTDFIIWARIMPTTKIPTRVEIVEFKHGAVVVCSGSYGVEGLQMPVTVLGLDGNCLTNTVVPAAALLPPNRWGTSGQFLFLGTNIDGAAIRLPIERLAH